MAMPDFGKLLAEAAIGKLVSDLQRDPLETLHRLSTQQTKSSDPQRAALLAQAKNLLAESAGYPALVTRIAQTLSAQRLKRLALNLGYQAGKRGREILAAAELRHGVHIPWTIFIELGAALDAARLQSLVEEGKSLGIYVYQLRCKSEAALSLLPLLTLKQPDCTFLLYFPPQLLTPKLLEQLKAGENLIPVLFCAPGEGRAASASLRERALLFGLCLSYGTTDLPALQAGHYAHYAQELGAAFALYQPREAISQTAFSAAFSQLSARRARGDLAILEACIPEDVCTLDRLLSKEALYLAFNADGARIETPYATSHGAENLLQSTLLAILETL